MIIKVKVYGRIREYATREIAIAEFHEGMLVCEGAESERYKNIYLQLISSDDDFIDGDD